MRSVECNISEKLASSGFSKRLSADLFKPSSGDEIILCPNYDGLYGINNINRMLQSENKGKAVDWGLKTYKIGDPILFNESNRFAPVLYNNLKGKITDLERIDAETLRVGVEAEVPLDDVDVMQVDGLRIVGSAKEGTTQLEFEITAFDEDSEDESSQSSIVPFQVAYAVSIHKAQGLEYDSVKIVVTKDVEKRITHNVFYTAITRARKYLSIYWSPEAEYNVVNSFSPTDYRKEMNLLKSRKTFQNMVKADVNI